MVNLRKYSSWNDTQITRHVLRDIWHLNARKRIIVICIKVNNNWVFARNDVVLPHNALGIPNDVFARSTFLKFCCLLLVVSWSNGVSQKEQTDTVYFLGAMDKVCNLIQFALGIMYFAKHLTILRLFKESVKPVEVAVKFICINTLSILWVLIDTKEEVDGNKVFITIESPAVKSHTVAVVIATEVHLVNIAHCLDVTYHQLRQLIFGAISHTKDFVKHFFLVLLNLCQFFGNNCIGDHILHFRRFLRYLEIVKLFFVRIHISFFIGLFLLLLFVFLGSSYPQRLWCDYFPVSTIVWSNTTDDPLFL